MENEEETYDIGKNAEQLGFWFLIFRYVFPMLAALLLALGLGTFILYFFALITPVAQ